MFGSFTIVARILGRHFFLSQKCCEKNTSDVFWKNIACLVFPKRIRSLVKPLLKNSFSTNFQGTGPWEGNSLFIGVFPRFTVAANFFRADPGAKRRKRTFYKSNRSFSFYCSFSLFFSLLFSLFFSSSFSSSLSLSFSSALSSSLSFSDYTFDKRQPNHHAEPHALQVLQVSQVHQQKNRYQLSPIEILT